MRKKLLATVAVAALLFGGMRPAHAQLSQGELTEALPGGIAQGMTDFFNAPLIGGLSLAAILLLIITTLEDWAGILAPDDRLAPTEPLIGSAPHSYVLPGGVAGAIPELYPPEMPLYSPLAALEHVDLQNIDRQERAIEAMDLTGEVMLRRPEVTAQLAALQAKNRGEMGVMGVLWGIQVGNEATIKVAESLEENTRVVAEAAQLEADQRLMERWKAQYYTMWSARHHPTLAADVGMAVDMLPRPLAGGF